MQFGGWAATTQGDVPLGSRQAWGLRFDYPNDLVNCTAGTNRYGDGFDPLLSFLPRPQTHQTDGILLLPSAFSPAGPFGAIRQVDLQSGLQPHHRYERESAIAAGYDRCPLSFTMNSGDIVDVNDLCRP